MRDWLAARPDLGHDAVKYRAGLKTAARHIHLPCPVGAEPLAEVGAFLFRPDRLPRYEHAMLDAWRRAHYEQGAVAELPFTVAEGFAAKHGMKREVFLKRAAPRMTRLERLRTQEQRAAVRRPGAPAAEVDLTVMPLTRLALYVLSLGFEQRAERRAELTGALRAAARRAAGGHAGSWGRVHAVLDDSFSSSGSGQKRRRPLAVALACHHLLEVLAAPGAYRGLWTSGAGDALLVRPWGPTPLGMRVLDALEPGPGGAAPDRLVIVSDGWDNAPAGLAGEVLRVWRRYWTRSGGRPWCTSTPYTTRTVSTCGGWRRGWRRPGSGTRRICPPWWRSPGSRRGARGRMELYAYLDRRVARFTGEGEEVEGAAP